MPAVTVPLRLVKMHSCGNDYVYLDAIGGPALPPGVDVGRAAAELSDRHFGVGGDGLIILYRAPSGRLGMRMFNSDGSEGLMCGNGLRCLAAYAHAEGYSPEPRLEVETKAGLVRADVRLRPGPGGQFAVVTVDLGPPGEIRPREVTLGGDGFSPDPRTYQGTYVFVGNPHFVVVVPDIVQVALAAVGPALETHPVFPDRANIEFVQVLSRSRLRMRVWERGSGITLACGTGAAASLVAAVAAGLADRRASLVLDGGELEVEWPENASVLVTGPAIEVFRTTYSRPLPGPR